MVEGKQPYNLLWRPRAESDLNTIIDYIAQDNPIRAKSFGQELRDKIRSLSQFPELGHKGRPGLPNWLYELVLHKHYIVFYHIVKETRSVEILRIKHVSQQIP